MNSHKTYLLALAIGTPIFIGVVYALIAMSFQDEQADYKELLEENGIQLGVKHVDKAGRRRVEIIGIYLHADSLGALNQRGQASIRTTKIMEVIQKCKDLTVCHLDHSDVDTQVILGLSSLLQLTSLRLSNTEVDDELCRALAMSETLSLLDVRQTAITDVGLTYLSGNPSLNKLIVGGDAITGEFLRAFTDNTSLHWIVIFGPNVDPKYLDTIHLTDIKRIALPCKPSDLPTTSIANSRLERIKVGWDAPLDAADKKAIREIEIKNPKIDVLISSPSVL